MAVRVEPYAAPWLPAVRDFNARVRAAGAAPGFLLDETGSANGHNAGALAKDRYLAVDGGHVRGGFMLQRQPFWIGGAVRRVANYQAPISEALIDRRYAYLGMLMLKEALREDPFMFCLGMGGLDRPLPRMLAAMKWTLSPVPFLFRIVRPWRVLRGLPSLRGTPRRRLAADAAAFSGLGALAVGALHLRARIGTRRAPALDADRVPTWGAWADEVWEASRAQDALAAVRDVAGLTALYPPEDARNICVRMTDGARVVGWAVLYDHRLRRHPHFGDLRLGTVLDCAARPGYEAAVAWAAACRLAARGVDLVVTNQAHARWIAAFRTAGFLAASSNYVLALSPALADAVRAQPDGARRVHATRGDADGRIHLA
jgi:hypothetical protein